ncbi:fungal-specific transcription factor domain-containing protein [Parachaetomium inaequale]|uniref:Fungal-specific transcription factor domain-containing protein n=1 Tax=Parachaetomium inaequale TaxID=2588326 RepID=A0AAN6ST01_9PEZI|nr:fungal-specific transcription factor domain-containing protein [Parachaetomium inaequale]
MDASNTKQCWECRRRRLVCDFTRPECRKCQLRGVACPGYDGKKPLKWLQPQQVNAKGPLKMAVPRAVKPESERQMGSVLEAIEYYNIHIAPDLIATGARGPGTPYWMPHSTAPYLPRSFTQSIVCTSLCHRILQSSDAPPSDQVVLARKLQRHRGDALRALTADLAQQELQTSDFTLASIQQSFDPPSWRNHSTGAAAMINMKGGFGNVILSSPHLRHLFRYHALIEILGNTTSPNVELDSVRNQLGLISLLPVLYGNGLATCFPCPPDLLAEIIRINHLRSIFEAAACTSTATKPAVREGQQSAALDILRRVRSFPTDKWAAEVVVGISAGEDPAFEAGFTGWHDIACIYRSAIAIYCISSLLHDNASGPCENTGVPGDPHLSPKQVLAKEREAYVSMLVSRLRDVIECTHLRKLVLWPLFVAGAEVEDETTKRFVADELRWISNALGTAAPLVAKDLLENRVWALGLGRGSWGALFDQSYVFVL